MAAALLRISRGARNLCCFSGKPAVLHRSIHTSVWWDMNSVPVPEGLDYSRIAGNITDALAKLNYSAPVALSAYVDSDRLDRLDGGDDGPERRALSSTGINVTDAFIRIYGREVSSKYILSDILFWTKDNPAPANCLIITGDRDLSFALHQLGMEGYNILLARPKELPSEVEAAAKIVWRWKSLLAGGPPVRTNYYISAAPH